MYNYNELKPEVFKERNQEDFLKIRDGVNATISVAGCITMGRAIGFTNGGDTWLRMAIVDRLVEMNEIVEVKQVGDIAGQHRIFTK